MLNQFPDFLPGRIINLSVGSLEMKLQNQLKVSLILFRNPAIGMIWINNQVSQAKKPLKKSFGRSTTALNFDIMAMLPLSL